MLHSLPWWFHHISCLFHPISFTLLNNFPSSCLSPLTHPTSPLILLIHLSIHQSSLSSNHFPFLLFPLSPIHIIPIYYSIRTNCSQPYTSSWPLLLLSMLSSPASCLPCNPSCSPSLLQFISPHLNSLNPLNPMTLPHSLSTLWPFPDGRYILSSIGKP